MKSLTIDPGELKPPFDPLEKEYNVYLDNEVSEIEVVPTAVSENATITVNGKETVSGSVYTAQLEEGMNEINIVVTNESQPPLLINNVGSQVSPEINRQEYRISVYRAGEEPNPFLQSLTINPGALNEPFDPAQEEYTATVSNAVYNLDVTAVPVDTNAVVTIGGQRADEQYSRTVPLNVGPNEINIQVSAGEEAVKSYKITVTRLDPPVNPNPNPNPGPVNPAPAPTTPVPSTPAPTTPTPTTPTTPTTPADGLEVIVNGQPTTIVATGGTSQVGGQTVFTATIDTARLATLLTGGSNQSVVIPVRTEADRVIATMTGEAAALLTSNNATLRVETTLGNYTLPSSQLRLGTAASTLGVQAGSADLSVNIVIEESGSDVQNRLTQAAAAQGFTGVSTPVDFTITASAGGRTAEVNDFTEYVERELPIPNGIDPNRVTTAVVIEPNGTVRHVPTAVTQVQSNDYAQVNSLTNSSYALIWNPKEFPDVAGKWSQAPVNDMASRLVVNGVGENRFNPEGAVTRAEFAAILVRALGLPSSGQAGGFSDVASGEWYAEAAATANGYGLITGYPDGTFRPNATITRQEAFAILNRATQIVPIRIVDGSSELSGYRDRGDVAGWAKDSAESVLSLGLVQGSGGWLHPEATLSRAESAAVAQRLLQHGALID
ncbi:S-layer homology domain-containing protein [Saccharibacillus alkalitolerans]|uniref:S-layer homology domain-containing protein n=1 Tax=Saccharibacillus alkalitolerans TaxID=2705290 RepID=UPI001F159F11|nr:S-layer homology domain-containing protein [Saccharibacillus alkalitolerans]